MKTLKILFVISLGGLVLLTGCDDLLSTEPAQSVSPEVALEDIRGTRGVALSTYTHLQRWSLYGNALVLLPEVMADNARVRAGASRHLTASTNQPRAHMTTVWSKGGANSPSAYEVINEANIVLESIADLDPSDPEVSQDELDRLAGEMYFMRALMYHNLVKIFGYEPGMSPSSGEGAGFDLGVIIRTEATSDAGGADFRSRSSVSEVYDLIKSDLAQSIDLLSHGDRGVYYGNHAAALALRARVALYERDWEGARAYASEAISATSISLVSGDDYASVSLADEDGSLVTSNINEITSIFDAAPNPESLFEVSISAQREMISPQNDGLASYLLPRQWQANVPPDDFLALFEDGDVRRLLYPSDDLERSTATPFTIKYFESRDTWADNVPVIRYPELLLIRAEAEAELGNIEAARDDVNTLRDARGASEITATSQDGMIDAIMVERRLELAFEGHRWFDLKRKGMNIRKPDGIGDTVPYNDRRILADLPSAEVALNENLVQNPGY